MKWLYVTHPKHEHARNVAITLYEAKRLGKWVTGAVIPSLPAVKSLLSSNKLKRRMIHEVPASLIHSVLGWDIGTILMRKLGGKKFEDFFWEKCELSLDSLAAKTLENNYDGIVGFEDGCLASLKKARQLEKTGVVIFASPHHSFLNEWVLPQLKIHKKWSNAWNEEAFRKAPRRDHRRDLEAETADIVFANSNLTQRTLINAGVCKDKVHSVPLGLYSNLPFKNFKPAPKLKVMYSGPVSLRKGFPYLHDAFLKLKTSNAELHIYGGFMVNKDMVKNERAIYFHGNVSKSDLFKAYSESDVLVFPTLCDGFGQVVGEALSCGLPVICSENAGAVEFIQNGINGFRIPACDSNAIHERLQYCLDNRSELHSMRSNCIENAKKWNWSDFRKKWFEVLMTNRRYGHV
jgi:glycosyltransferase involved in cell wall biosynthesis